MDKYRLGILLSLLICSNIFYVEAESLNNLNKKALRTKLEKIEPIKIEPINLPASKSGGQQEVKIKLFFPRLGYQNPSTAIPKPPNWYYYWKDGGVCGITDLVHYDNKDIFGYYIPGEDHIHICNLAPTRNTGPETYTNDDGESITVTGQGIGPQCVAETIAHELLHKKIYDDWNALIVEAEKNGQYNKDDYDDPDNDRIPNIMEANFMGIKTKEDDPDTYNMGGKYSKNGDNEIRCRKKELNPGINVDTSKDWAHPGTNSDPPYDP